MSDRRVEEPQTEELPLDDVEVEDAAPVTAKRPGPPPLPSRRVVEPATSTKPTDPPPPPPTRPSMPPPVAAALRIGPKAPARLSRSLAPPKPVTGSKSAVAPKTTAEALARTKPPPPTDDAAAKVTKPLRRADGRRVATAPRASSSSTRAPASSPPRPSTLPRPSAPPPPTVTSKATRASAPSPAATSARPPLRSSPPPLRSSPPSSQVGPSRSNSTPTAAIGAAAQQARLRFLEDEVATLRRDLERRGGELERMLDDLDGRGKRAAETLEARATLLDERLEELSEGVARDGEDVRDRLETMAIEVHRLKVVREELAEALDDVKATLRRHEQTLDERLAELRTELATLRRREAIDIDALRAELLAHTEIQQKKLIDAYFAGTRQELLEQLASLEQDRPTRRRARAPKQAMLTDIRGVGPASAKKLAAAGVQTPSQVAAWSDADIERLHRKLSVSLKRLRQWRANAEEL